MQERISGAAAVLEDGAKASRSRVSYLDIRNGAVDATTITYQLVGLVFHMNHEDMASHWDPGSVSRIWHSGKWANLGLQDELGVLETV